MLKANIAIDAAYVITMDNIDTLITNGTILINGKHISYVGSRLEASEYIADQYIDAKDSVVLPPFFNQHTHPSMSVYRGLGVDLALNDWLEKAMWPLEQKFSNPDNVYLGSMLSALEMIKGGIGATANMDFHNHSVGKAYSKSGLRAFLGEAIFSTPTPSCATPEETFEYTKSLVNQYADSELIEAFLAVHAPYTSTPELYSKTAIVAQELGILTTSHVSESSKEVNWSTEKYGKTPVELVESTGILDTDFVLIHGVHLSNSDIEILKKYEIPLIHNPHSNMVLGSGVCRVPELLKEGIQVGLGTDSAASNNALSMMNEMQSMSRIHKVFSQNASVLPAKQALTIATRSGYEIYQLKSAGQISNNFLADLQVIRMTNCHSTPNTNPVASLVHSSHVSDVQSLIVNGEILMLNRKVLSIDEESVLKEAKKLAVEIQNFIA